MNIHSLSDNIRHVTTPHGVTLIHCLIMAGWLFAAATIGSAIRVQATTHKTLNQNWRFPVAALALALALAWRLRLTHLDPNLTGVLMAVEPLLLTWPFVARSNRPEAWDTDVADLILGGILCLLALVAGGIWRLTHYGAIVALPMSHVWRGLCVGAAIAGQLSLGRQRRLSLRTALLLLAAGAILAILGVPNSESIAVLAAMPLILLEFYHALTRPEPLPPRASADAAATAQESQHEHKASPLPDAPATNQTLVSQPARRRRAASLDNKRQLAFLTQASIEIVDTLELPSMLRAVLEAITQVLATDTAYIFLTHEDPDPCFLLVSRYGTAQCKVPTPLIAISETHLPTLFQTLQRSKTLTLNKRDWNIGPALDALYHLLGETQSGPTIFQPLMHHGHSQGLLMVGNPRSQASLPDKASQLCEALAAQIAAAVAHARIYQQLHTQTQELQDLLTVSRTETTRKQAILESIADGVIVTDIADQVVLVNDTAARLLDAQRQDLIGYPFGQILARMVPLGDLGAVGATTQDSSSSNGIQAVFKLDGQVLRTSMAPVLTPQGIPLGMVSVLRDITPEYKADQAKSEFITNISHELRTPLTALKGYIDLLTSGAAGELSQTQSQFLGVVQNNTERLVELVNSVIAIAELEQGTLQVQTQLVDLQALLSEATGAIAPLCDERPLSLAVEIYPDLPTIQGDPTRLRQMLDYLLDNACKFTPPGGKISVQACIANPLHSACTTRKSLAATSETVIAITVRDSGVGISKADQGHIFEHFFRAESAIEAEAAGLGVGLTIVKAIVDAHDGRVWVQSQLGNGSTFTVLLSTG